MRYCASNGLLPMFLSTSLLFSILLSLSLEKDSSGYLSYSVFPYSKHPLLLNIGSERTEEPSAKEYAYDKVKQIDNVDNLLINAHKIGIHIDDFINGTIKSL